MDNDRKWHLAWAKLGSFVKHTPTPVEESHVVEFHAILDLLHEASGEDTSPFRIPDDAVKPVITSVRPGTRRMAGSATYSKKKYCDADLMRRKIDEVYGYFNSIQPKEVPEKPKYGF